VRRVLIAALVAALGLPAVVPGAAPDAHAGPRTARHPIQKQLYAYGDAAKDDRWTGSDATYSVSLPDGRTIWMWGDTFLGRVNADHSRDNQYFIHNTWTIQERSGKFGKTLFLKDGLFGGSRAWENHNPDANVWYWPGDATVVGNTLEHILFKITGAGPAFGIVGVDIATYALPSLKLQSIEALAGGFTPPVAQVGGGGQTAYGVAIMEDADYTYVYGCEEWLIDKHLHVARVKRGASLKTPWEYWDGTTWSINPVTSKRILSRISNEMSVVRTSKGFRVVTQDVGILPEIYAYTAPRPEGPWGGRTLIYETPENQETLMTYNAKEHPQLARPDRIVISYNVNVKNGNDLYTDVDNYRPRFVEVFMPSRLPAKPLPRR
jgi:hypothetical protein